MGFWSEFKSFAIKGNVVDMAVGVMIGAAFGGVVKSVVSDLIMPPIGLISGGLDLSEQYIVLKEGAAAGAPYESLAAAREAGAVLLSYGSFLNTLTNFAIVAVVLFFMVRWMNDLRSPDTPPAPNTKPCPFCMTAIHKEATRCPSCTSELGEEEASAA